MGSTDTVVICIIIAFFLASGYIYYRGESAELVRVKSGVDGQSYLVRNMSDKQYAADMMAQIKQNLVILANHLYKNYPKRESVVLLKARFDPTRLVEKAQAEKNTSYTINKGEKVVLCLRARNSDESLEDMNTMMFVAIHEMSHIMSRSVGHEDAEFWSNFKFALQNAEEIGLYENEDYKAQPKMYCGMKITDSPLNDASIKVE